MAKRKSLGKGLDALFSEIGAGVEEEGVTAALVKPCPVDDIFPNPHQPRKRFDDDTIDELAASLKLNGMLQPLIVRKSPGGYELIAGERRWRAAIKAGIEEVPILVKDVSDDQALVLSLVENLQRENLNSLEEAEAYQRLTNDFHLSQEAVADIVGKDRSTVTNSLRLLKLPERIKEDLAAGKITSGHARALLGLESFAKMLKLHSEILVKELSVREVERLLKKVKREKSTALKKEDVQITSLKEKLQYLLGTQVKIVRKGKKGRIEISFFSDDDLERVLDIVQKGARTHGT